MTVDKLTADRWLERYFAAEATLEEEAGLRTYFRSGHHHPDHEIYFPLFEWAAEKADAKLSPDFEDRILSHIREEQFPVRHLPWRRTLAVAASLTLLVAASWWLSHQTPDFGRSSLTLEEDTYSDPEEAYIQFTAALAMVAGALDQGRQITMESVAPAEGLNILIIQ